MPKFKSFKPKLNPFAAVEGTPTPPPVENEVQAAPSNEPPTQSFKKPGVTKELKLIPLGGVGDVTKNMYVYEYGNDIVIVDCGIGFPDEGMLGIDLVIPDITYLRDKKDKIRAIIISHGHEDHIGSLPFIWPELNNCPIYAPKLAAGFIKSKFAENKLPKDVVKVLEYGQTLELGVFRVCSYQASHSVPDASGIVIDTPVGRIVHQPDFKLDWTPVNGQLTDVQTLAQKGKEGVLFLLIDSLGVEKHGFTESERKIQNTFAELEKKAVGKLIITTNSSNITRVQQAINVAVESGRKVALVGRSMDQNFQVARDLGYLDVPPGVVIASDEIKRFADENLLILIAGSQGQPGSSLSRLVNSDHKLLTLKKGDVVVFSADPIPSSMLNYYSMVDNLCKKGFDTYYPDVQPDLHVSGHARAEEIKVMINLVKPQFLMPIGATFRGMRAFANMAKSMGYKDNQVMLIEDGRALSLTPNRVEPGERVEAKNIYVDGLGVGDVGSVVLRDRQVMAEEGIVLVIVPLDYRTSKIMGDVDIVSRGFVFEKESEGLLKEARGVVESVLSDHQEGPLDWRYARTHIEESLQKFFYDETKRRPLILPIVVEV